MNFTNLNSKAVSIQFASNLHALLRKVKEIFDMKGNFTRTLNL